MSIKNAQSFFSDDHGGVTLFGSCEPEMVNSLKSLRLAALEYKIHSKEKIPDRDLPSQPIFNPLRFLVRIAPGNEVFCIGIGDYVNRLWLLLERFDDVIEERLSVRQKWGNHILTSRTNGHAVRSLIVRAVGEALPHRLGLGIGYLLP